MVFDLEADDPGADPPKVPVTVTVRSAKGKVLAKAEPKLRAGHGVTTFDDLPPGTHSVTVDGSAPSSVVRPITSTAVVWPSPRADLQTLTVSVRGGCVEHPRRRRST